MKYSRVPDKFAPTLPTRDWLIHPLGGNPLWTAFAAVVPALLGMVVLEAKVSYISLCHSLIPPHYVVKYEYAYDCFTIFVIIEDLLLMSVSVLVVIQLVI